MAKLLSAHHDFSAMRNWCYHPVFRQVVVLIEKFMALFRKNQEFQRLDGMVRRRGVTMNGDSEYDFKLSPVADDLSAFPAACQRRQAKEASAAGS